MTLTTMPMQWHRYQSYSTIEKQESSADESERAAFEWNGITAVVPAGPRSQQDLTEKYDADNIALVAPW